MLSILGVGVGLGFVSPRVLRGEIRASSMVTSSMLARASAGVR
jgi:hypothetical protein